MHVDTFLLFQTPDCIWESAPAMHLNVLCSERELVLCQVSWSRVFVWASNRK